MQISVLRGKIARRLLVNFRADADVVRRMLPQPFEPMTVDGCAMVGICLIRLDRMRPAVLPLPLGMASENAAHRIAVQWLEAGERRTGVYVARRDTGSSVNAMLGGLLFPGMHHLSRFDSAMREGACSVDMCDAKSGMKVTVRGRVTDAWPETSVFRSLDEASAFFQQGADGFSPRFDGATLDGLRLVCDKWQVEPFEVDACSSTYFEDARLFPKGSVTFDCALIMRDVEHCWQPVPAPSIARA